MKKIYLFASLIFMLNAFAQKNNFSQGKYSHNNKVGRSNYSEKKTNLFQLASITVSYDSIYRWQLDTSTMGWTYLGKQIFSNNSQNKMTNQLYQYWLGGAWKNETQGTYAYDANGNLINVTSQNWSGTSWVNYYQEVYTYDANNNQTSALELDWNGTGWDSTALDNYTYDVNNNRTSDIHSLNYGSGFVNGQRHICVYSSNNLMTSDTIQDWDSTVWKSSQLGIYTYDQNNNEVSSLTQTWNGVSWDTNNRWINTFTSNNLRVSELDQSWNGSTWVNVYQYPYFVYDTSNNLLISPLEQWNGSSWDMIGKLFDIYDSNGVFYTEYGFSYNIPGSTIRTGDSAVFYYHSAVANVSQLKNNSERINIYPNPTVYKFTIQTNSNENLLIDLYDINGKHVLSKIFSGASDVDVSNLDNGVYTLSIKTNSGRLHKKLIISR